MTLRKTWVGKGGHDQYTRLLAVRKNLEMHELLGILPVRSPHCSRNRDGATFALTLGSTTCYSCQKIPQRVERAVLPDCVARTITIEGSRASSNRLN